MPGPALVVLGGISAAAGVISGITTIIDHGHINDNLKEILEQLQGLRNTIVTATAEILEGIENVRRQINEDVALDAIAFADRALFNDAALFNNEQQALGNSFQAANRLFLESDIVFTSSFMYVVTLRIAVLKHFRPNYYCDNQFKDEFQGYLNKLTGWSQQINESITRLHTVTIEIQELGPRHSDDRTIRWVGTHFRSGLIVNRFFGGLNDWDARARVEQLANASRARGIQKDRQDSGVIEIEKTAAAWQAAFQGICAVPPSPILG